MRKALDGVQVVELGGGIATSYCGKLLADLGADVTKVEPPGGDLLRSRGGAFVHVNTNKSAIVLDPHDPAGRRQLRDLLRGADLAIESRPGSGALSAWQLDWDALHAEQPGLSVVCISGFGATGPYSSYTWDDIVVQAAAGAMLLQNHPEQHPLRLPGQLALYFVGHMAALGALSAVSVADRSGEGSFVDCAAAEALATLPARQAPLLAWYYRGSTPPPAELLAAGTATLIPTGVFPCADGYMAMMSTPQQLDEMLEVLDDDGARAAFDHPDAFERPETKEALDVAVYMWLATHTRAQATDLAQRAGWPLAGVNLIGEVLHADHLHQRGFWTHTDDPRHGSLDLPGPWCRFAEGGWSIRRLAPESEPESAPPGLQAADEPEKVAPARVGDRRPPLEGIRVVDLTTVWAGPYATMLLADLGAEVIRVENPFVLPPTTKGYHPRPLLSNPGFLGSMYGAQAPGRPDRPWNRHAMNNSLARNKLSVTIDTRRPEGLQLLMRLAEVSDVFVDNFKANGLERIGIDVGELRRRNPSLIILRLPPTGLTGDWAGYTGFGAQFDGLTGLLSICGHRGSDMTSSPATTYMDGASGPAGAFATMAALRYRDATGRGQFVELAQSENIINHLGDLFVDQQLGHEPERMGNRDRWRAPQGLYPCRGENRWLAVTCPDDITWRALAEVIGRPDLASDPALSGLAGRHDAHDMLDDAIGAWTAERDAVDAFHTLQRAGVAACPLFDDELLTSDPHLAARGWLQPLASGDVGTHPHPGLAFRGVPQVWRRGSPTLGEDNDYVYKSLLGVTDEEFEQYREDRILAEDYLMADGTPY